MPVVEPADVPAVPAPVPVAAVVPWAPTDTTPGVLAAGLGLFADTDDAADEFVGGVGGVDLAASGTVGVAGPGAAVVKPWAEGDAASVAGIETPAPAGAAESAGLPATGVTISCINRWQCISLMGESQNGTWKIFSR